MPSAITVFNDTNFDYNFNIVVSKLNHLPNDIVDGLFPFKIIFNRLSPLLTGLEKQAYENLLIAEAMEKCMQCQLIEPMRETLKVNV